MNAPIPSPGEHMVYLVPSASNSTRTYRVDLIANGGAGECACKDWATRRGPAVKDGQPHGTRETLCKHLIAARRHFLNGLLASLAKQEEGKK